MIVDFADADAEIDLTADLCIIGAGPAGITIAREMIGSALEVCLLEGGSLDFEPSSQSLYEAHNAGLPRQAHDVTRLRYFGGTSNHWTGQCAPFLDEDFAARDWVPFSGWSLGRQHLEPYYERAYPLCELTRDPFDKSDAFLARQGLADFRSERMRPYFLQLSPPTRFGPAHKAALEQARNVRVVLHANVTDIVANGNARAVERVRFRRLDGREGTVRARHVVLCCGGIENARLLLLSNGIVKAGLGNQNDVVGRYLSDHPFGRVGLVQGSGRTRLGAKFGDHRIDDRRFRFGLALSPLVQQSEKILGCGLQLWPRAESVTESPSENESMSLSFFDNAVVEFNRHWDRLVQKLMSPFEDAKPELFDLMAVAEQAPNPLSRVSLARDRDALGLNRAIVDWRLTGLDRRTRQASAYQLASELGRLGVGRVRIGDWLQDDGDWTSEVSDYNHHMGTTRMADDPRRGVVDRHCRVHGLENLYVAGSSVFPTSSFVNPTLTIVALALRLADHLKQSHR